MPRVEDRELAVEADGGARDEWPAVPHASRVDRLAGGEVVTAIEHHVGLGHQRIETLARQPLGQRHHLDVRVQGADRSLRRHRLGHADAGQVVRDLPLQVGQVDRVAVGDRQAADAGRAEIETCRRTEASRADDQRV